MNTLSVSSLTEQIKGLLETSFSQVLVEGELSRITFHNSGHIYFTLKDDSSVISAVMFRGNASKLKFRLEEGMKVVINAAISLYKPRGSYQINCFSIEPSGQGALSLAYEQLKEKLSVQGYFAQEIKKQLPRFPFRIALVTSATGAALQDMLRVANARYRLLEVDIYDVLVQGQNAAYEISNAIIYSDTQEYDIIVLARGGGSMEDLWAFNEEVVANAIFNAKTPIVSAIGHEIDWLISDEVADLRAPTPSAAMEMILPDSNELFQSLDITASSLTQNLEQKIFNRHNELEHLKNSYSQHSVEKKLTLKFQEIQRLKDSFNQTIDFKVKNVAQNQLLHLQKMLESNHPKLKSKRGFAQISQNGVVLELSTLENGDIFEAQSSEVKISAKVIKKENIL